MPRPKRTKVGTTAPRRVEKVQNKAPPTTALSRNQPDLPERFSAGISDSEDSMGLVTKTRTRRRSTRNMDDAVMTGALPVGTTPGRPRRQALKKLVKDSEQDKAIEALKKRREAVLKTGTQPASRHTTAPSGVTGQLSPLRKSPAATVTEQRGRSPPRIAPPASASKVQNTPGVQALKSFKPRQRQSSILKMVKPVDDSLGDITGDFDDFDPDDESTPLTLGKRKSSSSGKAMHSAQVVASDDPRTSSSRKRKQRQPTLEAHPVSDIQVPRSSPPAPSPTPVPRYIRETTADLYAEPSPPREMVPDTQQSQHTPPRVTTPDVDVLDLPGTPSPARNLVPATQDSASDSPLSDPPLPSVELEPESDTMAPPLSSSPSKSTSQQSSRGGTKPNIKVPASQPETKFPALSTKALQALLPKRRNVGRGQRDVFDFTAEETDEPLELDSDEDELQVAPKGRRVVRKNAPKPPVKAVGKAKAKAKNTRSKAAAAAAKEKMLKKTYGRKVSSDKENAEGEYSEGEDVTGEVSVETVVPKSAELVKAAEFFKEVDDWEMEFESVDAGGESSPWR